MAQAINRWEPGTGLALRDAMNQLFEESFVRPFFRAGNGPGHQYLPVDVYETDDAFVVKAFIPGLTPDDLTVSVEQQTVTLHGEPKAEDLPGMRPLLQERRISAFTRSFTLPVLVDADKVQAELAQGVLSLTLPKSKALKPRTIQVKSS